MTTDTHLHAVDRHLRDASPPRWRATPNPPLQRAPVLQLISSARQERNERTFALEAESQLDEEDRRRGVATVPGWQRMEPPPTGRHVPRAESCRHFFAGLIFVLAGSVLIAWGFTSLVAFLRSLG